jgi:hypothetical protein
MVALKLDFTHPGVGLNQVSIAYVLKKEELKRYTY